MVKYQGHANGIVDVCVVTYNHGRYLAECLNSLLKQSFVNNIRIWVHDDCSTDDTKEIMSYYTTRYPMQISCFSQPENLFSRSPYDFQLGIGKYFSRVVSGEFLCFIDGDDFWVDEKKIETQVEFLSANRQYSVAFHDVICVDREGNYLRDWMPESAKKDYAPLDLQRFNYSYIHASASLYRNLNTIITPEILMSANGDMFAPHLFGAGGSAKFIRSIYPSAYRQTGDGIWTSLDDRNKSGSKLLFSSLMVARLLSIGDLEGALLQVQSRVIPNARLLQHRSLSPGKSLSRP